MSLRTLVVSVLFLGSASAAVDDGSGRDVLANFYGNTLISLDHGIESHFYYRPDHTFTGKVPAYYMVFKGTWYQKPDGTICRVFDPPLPTLQNPDCGPMRVGKVGDREREPNGDAEKLVAGIR